MRSIEEIVPSEYNERLIKDYLRYGLGLSSTLIKKVKLGGVFVNGANVHMRHILHTGDKVEVFLPIESSENVPQIEGDITVIYEDDYLICVDKPKAMPTHPSRFNSLTTLASIVAAHLGKPFVFRAITRLDRDTSGIVLIAKDQISAAQLSADMRAGLIKKTYLALLSGTPEPRSGVICAPIERESPDSIKRVVCENGKSAITEYSVIRTLEGGRSICELHPITGRTHQLRVHMAHVGCPLENDFLYGVRASDEQYKLRCVALEFIHPVTKKQMRVNADTSEFDNA